MYCEIETFVVLNTHLQLKAIVAIAFCICCLVVISSPYITVLQNIAILCTCAHANWISNFLHTDVYDGVQKPTNFLRTCKYLTTHSITFMVVDCTY